jgi:competence protein ComEA
MGDMPELSVSRSRALAAVVAGLVLLVLAGRFVLGAGAASGAERGAEVVAAPVAAAPAPPVVVHVVGAVREPGLYRVARGQRVADAVARAGGATGGADLARINLAAPVADGQQVVVPARASPGAVAPGAASAGAGAPSSGPVSLNSATLEQLDALPGVGPVTTELS